LQQFSPALDCTMKVINFLVDALLGFGKGDITPKSTIARVTSLQLIQPKTGAVLLPNITNGTIFYHDDNNEFSIKAVTSDGPLPIQGVQFDWNGKRNYRTDRYEPYALCRRSNPSCVSNGAHIVTATGLNKEIPFRVQFEIVRGREPDASMPSTPMPIAPTPPPNVARDPTVAPQAKPTAAPRSAPVASPVVAPVTAPKTVPVAPPRTAPKATVPKAAAPKAPATAPKASSPISTPSAVVAPMTAPSAIAPMAMIAPVSAPNSASTPIVDPTTSPTAAPAVLPTSLAPVVPAPTAASAWGPAIMLINCGGDNYTDTTGRIWRADAFFSGGSVSKVNKSIAGTDEDVLYASERFGKSTYNIPLPAGEYAVVLHMAEL
jgi:Malectin domain